MGDAVPVWLTSLLLLLPPGVQSSVPLWLLEEAGSSAPTLQERDGEGQDDDKDKISTPRSQESGDEKHSDDADDSNDSDDHKVSGHGSGHGGHVPRLSDESGPLVLEGFPERPKPLIELGEPFLGTGTLEPGFKLPTGAVWQPAFLAFGTLRTAAQALDAGTGEIAEVVARLDLFGNLSLSGTERLVIGLRSLDEDGQFTSYVFDSEGFGEDGYRDRLNLNIGSLFFEGDFGEIFPNLSRDDTSRTDWGFAIGRQPLIFQEGLLINDVIDSIGITRNTVLPKNTSNFRATFLLGLDDIDRADASADRRNREDRDALLLAVLTSTDFRATTLDVDLAYVDTDFGGDQANLGVSAVQRFGKISSSFFAAVSRATGDEGDLAADGVLVSGELSWVPHATHDHLYVTAFAALDDYRPIARDPALGGPLGRVGINFASVGIGSLGAPLSNQAREVVGGAVGRQFFFDDTRRQLILEAGLRIGLESDVADQFAGTARYQMAVGRRFVWVFDVFGGRRESLGVGDDDQTLLGGRVELVTKF